MPKLSSTCRSVTNGASAVSGFPPCGLGIVPGPLILIPSLVFHVLKKKKKKRKEIYEFPTIHFCF